MKDNLLEYLKDKKIAILGFGREGKSSYQFLRRYFPDKHLDIYDKNEALKQDEFIKEDTNIKFEPIFTNQEVLENHDLVLKTSGLSLKDIDVTPYREKITSQISLLLDFFDILTIGITGTKGKSTTTSLIYEVLKEQKENVLIGGNIGIPVFDNIEKITPDSIYVIELSAYQLQYIHKAPKISILLNLFEEHIDFFGNLDNYYNAKINIAKYQTAADVLFYKGDNDELLKRIKGNIRGASYKIYDKKPISFEEKAIYVKDNQVYITEKNQEEMIYDANEKRNLLGDNNLRDIMFVLGVCKYLKLDMEKARKTINSFKGLPHRMEYVGCFKGVHYYNDAIATIPEATINNIETLKSVNTLIFGGMNRKIDYTKLLEYLRKGTIKNLICMPETGTQIGTVLQEKGISSNIYFTETLEEAVKIAKEVTEKEKICMMSPAAPSYNQFKDFEEKGNTYKKLVKEEY